MKVGEELDALVAEKVMGLDCSYRRVTLDGRNKDLGPVRYIKPYSTDIAATWLVVDRLVELGFDCWSISDDEVYFKDPSVSDGAAFGSAIPGSKITIPHAICLAALVAVKS